MRRDRTGVAPILTTDLFGGIATVFGGSRHQEGVAGPRPRSRSSPLGMLDPADSRVDVHIEQIRDRGRRRVYGGGGGLTRSDDGPHRLRVRRATSPEGVRASRLR